MWCSSEKFILVKKIPTPGCTENRPPKSKRRSVMERERDCAPQKARPGCIYCHSFHLLYHFFKLNSRTYMLLISHMHILIHSYNAWDCIRVNLSPDICMSLGTWPQSSVPWGTFHAPNEWRRVAGPQCHLGVQERGLPLQRLQPPRLCWLHRIRVRLQHAHSWHFCVHN